MQPTLRMLARYLEPGTPTGLVGLCTHSHPRSALLYLYASTLHKLQSIPENSLYRQSVEAVTRHRMNLVDRIVPAGYNEWAVKAKAIISKNPSQSRIAGELFNYSEARTLQLGGRVYIIGPNTQTGDVSSGGGDAEADSRSVQMIWAERESLKVDQDIEWEDEPQLTAGQIQELEHGIGAGLVEEVIQVAEGELHTIETMEKHRVWEDLEETPVEGQWEYFDRKST
ncbi:hypothetical protein E4U32_004593 [Claviceps aff. humidiphila group G2b]|nr:hypothetical protein E4U32_004593 [Claviceps aff. humidiphila group G2b]